MVNFIDLGDGTVCKSLSPLREVPFFSDWLDVLLSRRAAFTYREKHRKCAGQGCEYCDKGYETIVKPYSGFQEQAAITNPDGSIHVLCIGCGTPTPYMDIVTTVKRGRKRGYAHEAVGKITIGGCVQFRIEEPGQGAHQGRQISLVRKWQRRPVSKRGHGCKACVEAFQAEEAALVQDYANKSILYSMFVDLYVGKLKVLRGEEADAVKAKLVALKEPKALTPFLDVFSHSVAAQQFTAFQAQRVG